MKKGTALLIAELRVILIVLFFNLCSFASFAEEPKAPIKILNNAEREMVENLAGLTLPKQAQAIRKKVTLELLKSNSKGGTHFFDFLGEPKKNVEDINNIEGRYGKVECRKKGEEVSRIYLADDAPPTTLLHFYIHYLQMGQEKRWCELEGRVLEGTEKNEQAIIFHSFEFETLKTLWDLKAKLTMNFEDELILLEGLTQENKILAKIGIKGLDEKTVGLVAHSLGILHSQISYLTWLSRSPSDAGSVLQKMEVLNLKSCVEATQGEDLLEKVNDCVSERCALGKVSCKKLTASDLKMAGGDVLSLVIGAWTKPNNIEDCPTSKLKDEFIDHLQEPSACWKSWYSEHHKGKNDLKLNEVAAKKIEKQFHVPSLNVDNEISFQEATSPDVFIQKAYCYFVFQRTSGYGTIPVDQFGYATQGAVISYYKLKAYRGWLDDKEGQTCSQLVKLFSGEDPARYENINPHNKHMLIINPLAALGGGTRKFKNLVSTDINHQRLHIIFAENKKVQKRVRGEWNQLSPSEQSEFEAKHSRYDFSDESTILREYFAYSRQEHPKKLF